MNEHLKNKFSTCFTRDTEGPPPVVLVPVLCTSNYDYAFSYKWIRSYGANKFHLVHKLILRFREPTPFVVMKGEEISEVRSTGTVKTSRAIICYRRCSPSFIISIFIASILMLSSCGEDQYQIDRKLDIALDTMFLAESKILKPELDSICKTRYETDLPRMVDSIVAMRKKQIAAQIERLKKQPE